MRAKRRNAKLATRPTAKAAATAPKARLRLRRGHEQAAIVEKTAEGQRQTVAHVGSVCQHRVIPEQQLQQQRQVAHNLDVPARRAGHEDVLGQAGDAHGKAQQRRQRDADGRHQQRVQQADPEGLAVRAETLRIRDQRLADGKARGLPKPQARRDLLATRRFSEDAFVTAS
jgi:hypothetical protein